MTAPRVSTWIAFAVGSEGPGTGMGVVACGMDASTNSVCVCIYVAVLWAGGAAVTDWDLDCAGALRRRWWVLQRPGG